MADNAAVVYDKKLLEEMAGQVAAELAIENKKRGEEMIEKIGFSRMQSMWAMRKMTREQAKKAAANRIGMGLKLIAQMHGGLSKGDASERAKAFDAKYGTDGWVEKVVQVSSATSGGYLIPEELSSDIIEYLRDEVVIYQLGAAEVEMMGGKFVWPSITAGVSASWTTEGTAVNVTAPTYGRLELNSRKLIVLVAVSNDFIDSDAIGGVNLVTQDMNMAMEDKLNSTFLRGNGAAGAPKGLRYLVKSTHELSQTMSGATVTIAEAGYDLLRLIYTPKSAKIKARNGHFIFSPRTTLALQSARDGNNNNVFLPEMTQGTLYGQRWHETTAIPDNLSVTTSADSEIIFGYMDTVVIGNDGQMSSELIRNAAYNNASGTVVAGASQDESLIRVVTKKDMGVRYEGAELAVIKDVNWTKLA